MTLHLQNPEHPLNFLPQKESFHMTREDARSVWLDYHLADRFAGELPEQRKIIEESQKKSLPEIQVGPFEGHLLYMVLRLMGAKRGVEIGTLGGYSASWICRAIEGQAGAHLDSLELNANFAQVAQENLRPWQSLFEIHVGNALESLHGKLSDLSDLDFVFIDADKAAYPKYFDWAWPRIRKGGVLLLDNFYLRGAIYFGKSGYPPKQPGTERSWEHYSLTQREAMRGLWQKLEDLGEAADKTILPTSEGLGIVRKNS